MKPIEKVGPPPAPELKRAKDIHTAALGFEELLVKQILSSAEVVKGGSGGYGAMALDALTSSIVSAGGLGLAACLEHQLEKTASKLGG